MSYLGHIYPYLNFPYQMRTIPVTIGHQNYHLPLVWVLNQEQSITKQQFNQMVKKSVSGYINFSISENGKQVKDMRDTEKIKLQNQIIENIKDVVIQITNELLKNKNIITKSLSITSTQTNKYHQGASDLNREINQLIRNAFNY